MGTAFIFFGAFVHPSDEILKSHLMFKEETEESGFTAPSSSATAAAASAEQSASESTANAEESEETKEGEEPTHAHASSSTKHDAKNQFNTSERAAQSFNYPSRVTLSIFEATNVLFNEFFSL